ncbi:ATP-binding protein [Algoriphagus pacificus]|uniref:ATP-binding protein n=1 Tax=Algoriphagus pacificus TaxID=2811234 RepID=A0ABS3CFR5_9BACT|nr:ATP-binding protein [Algoriphagus pacificus]MBN7815640.1 ATP-binding protein [Algoriphagus pacificus]
MGSQIKKYPFKFLDSYQKEDKSVFFGRDEEINSLYEMVFQSAVVLVYGASGTGKTSLINCGLAGRFQTHDWLEIMVRRGKDINQSLETALANLGGDKQSVIDKQKWENDWEEEFGVGDKSLTPLARSIKTIYQKSFRPIYLIFDQFEELFVLGTKLEQQTFLESIKGILESRQPVKLIFSIREEYLGYLTEFEREIPQLLRKKLRVEPMNLEKVKQVIIGAASFENSIISIKAGEEDAVAEAIFQKIKGDKKSLTIALPFLQVFLDKLYMEISGDETRQKPAEFSLASVKEMGEIGDVLGNFLEDQVSRIADDLNGKYGTINQELIWKILSPFATLEGTKEPIGKNELFDRLPEFEQQMVLDVVQAFITSRILRYNDTNETYEIAHDSLAKPIADKRSVDEKAVLEVKRLIKSQVGVKEEARELFTEKQLIFLEPYLGKFKLSEEESNWVTKSRESLKNEKQKEAKRKYEELVKSKKSMFLKIAVFVFVIIAGLFVYLAIQAQKNAILAEEEALEAKKANDYSSELLRLVMEGRGDQYANVSDSLLKQILYRERTAPLSELIEVKASVSPSNAGGENKNYTLWLDMPSFRKDEIKEVQYNFCRGFADRLRISKDPTSSFSIGYLGWGYCPIMRIDVILQSGDTIRKEFSFERYFEENPPIN